MFTAHETDVRRSDFRDRAIGIQEQHIIEAFALRGTAVLHRAEQTDVLDRRIFASVRDGLQPPRLTVERAGLLGIRDLRRAWSAGASGVAGCVVGDGLG